MSSPQSQMRRFGRHIDGLMGGHVDGCMDKSVMARMHVDYMLARTQRMFDWRGLPDSIPARMLELYLQCNGHTCIYEYDGRLYALFGAPGGEPDAYYRPTLYIVANPALRLNASLTIDRDCVLILNDSMYMGLLPLSYRYAYALVENEISMRLASINLRATAVISASDDRSRASAEKYLSDLADGRQGIIAENAFLEGVNVHPSAPSAGRPLTDLIEMEQYLRASWYNDIGLDANYNMKRESLTTTEAQMNSDALLPLVDDMLACRRWGAERINAMYGTNITVELASSWRDNQQEINAAHNAAGMEDDNNDGTDPTSE